MDLNTFQTLAVKLGAERDESGALIFVSSKGPSVQYDNEHNLPDNFNYLFVLAAEVGCSSSEVCQIMELAEDTDTHPNDIGKNVHTKTILVDAVYTMLNDMGHFKNEEIEYGL